MSRCYNVNTKFGNNIVYDGDALLICFFCLLRYMCSVLYSELFTFYIRKEPQTVFIGFILKLFVLLPNSNIRTLPISSVYFAILYSNSNASILYKQLHLPYLKIRTDIKQLTDHCLLSLNFIIGQLTLI